MEVEELQTAAVAAGPTCDLVRDVVVRVGVVGVGGGRGVVRERVGRAGGDVSAPGAPRTGGRGEGEWGGDGGGCGDIGVRVGGGTCVYGRGDGEVDGEVEFLLFHSVSSRARVCPRRSNHTPLAQRPDRFRTPSQSWPLPQRLLAFPPQGEKQQLRLEEQVGPYSEPWAPGYRLMQLAVALAAAVLSGKMQRQMCSTRRAAALDGGSGSGPRSCGSF